MRVVQLIDAPRRRGAEVFAFQLGQGFRQRGHEVKLIALRSASTDGDSFEVDQTIGDWSGRGLSLSVARAVAAIARRFGADIVQANGGSTPKSAALARFLDPRGQWKLVYRNIGDVRVWMSTPAKRMFYRLAVWPKLDGVISVSRQAKAGLHEVFGEDGPPVEVIYQGVDEDGLSPRMTRPEVRRRLTTSEDEIAIVWVGALSREKRPDRALRVMSKVKSVTDPVVLWMVGAGPMGDELLAAARDLGVADRIRWVGAVEDVGTYLHAADVFLLTSDTEGVPGALLEAMTVGLPSVVTDVGGISEVVDDGRTGFLALPDDELATVDRLSRLTMDVTLRERMGADARVVACQRFDMDTCIEHYEAFYQSILDRGGNSMAARQIDC